MCNIIYKSIEILGFEKKFSCFLLTDALTSCIFLLTSSYTSDEKEEYARSTATESFRLVQGSAGDFAEDGLGADWLKRKFRSSGRTRYSAEVLMA